MSTFVLNKLINIIFLNREENSNDDSILDITDTSSHRAKMTKAQVKKID
jgi:hypothetical protein